MSSLATWKTSPRVRASLEAARRSEENADAVAAIYGGEFAEYRLTIGLNWHGATRQDGRFLIRGLLAALDQSTHGKNFNRKPSRLRTWAYLIPARQEGGRLHYHGVLGFPAFVTYEDDVLEWIAGYLRDQWPKADCHLDALDPKQAEAWAGYSTKDDATPGEAVSSLEFHKQTPGSGTLNK
jgi:hypothetical protein